MKILNKKPAPRRCFYHVKERKTQINKKYSEVKLVCQAGNPDSHGNVKVESNLVKPIKLPITRLKTTNNIPSVLKAILSTRILKYDYVL